MRRNSRRFPLIRAGIILFIILLAIYIPLKIYLVTSDKDESKEDRESTLSIFFTGELNGYWKPCG